jgi:Lrp/AsnC family transcriptional regulator for asnA, asnC and gidA
VNNSNLDKTDISILNYLMQDAKMPHSEIAKKLFISAGTVHLRIKKIEELGLLNGANLKVNLNLLGYGVSAFLGIYLSKSSKYKEVVTELEKIKEVVELHYTTGMYSMFIKVICKDTTDLKLLLIDKIQQIEAITRTETFIILEETLNRPIHLDIQNYTD